MSEVIESLTKNIRKAAAELAENPNEKELQRKLLALVMAVNVIEIYLYDDVITKYEEALNYVCH